MSAFFIAVAVISGLIAICAGLGAFVVWIDGSEEHAVICGLVLAVIAVLAVGLCVKSSIAAMRTIGRQSCESFGGQTGYETNLIITNTFDGGTCYVRFNGSWVPRSGLWAEMRS